MVYLNQKIKQTKASNASATPSRNNKREPVKFFAPGGLCPLPLALFGCSCEIRSAGCACGGFGVLPPSCSDCCRRFGWWPRPDISILYASSMLISEISDTSLKSEISDTSISKMAKDQVPRTGSHVQRQASQIGCTVLLLIIWRAQRQTKMSMKRRN